MLMMATSNAKMGTLAAHIYSKLPEQLRALEDIALLAAKSIVENKLRDVARNWIPRELLNKSPELRKKRQPMLEDP